MTCVLALDPGSRCGWALAKEGAPKPRAGVVTMPDVTAENIGVWANAYEEWLEPFCKMNEVTHIVQEAPIIAQHRSENGAMHNNIYPVIKAIGIMVCTAKVAARLDLPKPELAVRSSVAKHFTGIGNGKRSEIKARCVAHAQVKGWNITSEDMADAVATLDWYVHKFEIKVGWDCKPSSGPLFTGIVNGKAKAVHVSTPRQMDMVRAAMRKTDPDWTPDN